MFAGCASMDIQQETVKMDSKLKKPSIIYVKSFQPGDDWQGDMEGKSKSEFVTQSMKELDVRMVKYLSEVAPAEMVPGSTPNRGLLVTGKLRHVDIGHGAIRFWVGFGAGAREVVGDVYIYDLSKSSTKPAATYEIRGGSRGESGIGGAIEGINTEWDRIAKETRDFILKNSE